MINIAGLRKMARARLADAEVLFAKRRYDGAVYLCGYAVELMLKARICPTLHWAGFPNTKSEWEGLASFKVHRLDMLLKLSGREAVIRLKHLAKWSVVARWDPESRYNPIGTATRTAAEDMIEATRAFLGVL